MNRRKVLKDLLFYLALWFVGPVLIDLVRKHSNFSSRMLIEDALGAIAISFGIVGIRELNRGGHRRAVRILGNCISVWFGVYLILLGIMILISKTFGIEFITKSTPTELLFEYSLYAFLALIATPFPAALFLKRIQSKSTSQSKIVNAS